MTTIPTAACPSCGSAIRPGAVYCRECGAMNLAATSLPTTSAHQTVSRTSEPPLLTPTAQQRPSVAHADQSTTRKPRYVLGTLWAVVTLVLTAAGLAGPGKWLLLLAIATGAYSVYLYRGGRYGFFFI